MLDQKNLNRNLDGGKTLWRKVVTCLSWVFFLSIHF